MSFILDALRKSENERRKHAPPGHADVRVMPTRQSRRPWIAFVGVLLGANVILLAIFWFGWYRNSDSVSASNGGPATSATLPDSGNKSGSGIGASAVAEDLRVRNLSKEARRGETVSSAASSSATQRSGDIAARVATSEPTSGGNSAYANLPTMNEAIVAGIRSVPPLHLDIHV